VELFAGAGFLTVGLARRHSRMVAVEGHRPAARDLRANLKAAGLGHVRVVAQPVERFLQLPPPDPAPDVVVLDPPRAGLGRGAPERLARFGAARIVYLSCDPATLARDLSRFVGAGYALSAVEAFDLFPQTPHVEALAVLDRS
jgi:23S rRNA (uracil1939-C5)-methyltransferase